MTLTPTGGRKVGLGPSKATVDRINLPSLLTYLRFDYLRKIKRLFSVANVHL